VQLSAAQVMPSCVRAQPVVSVSIMFDAVHVPEAQLLSVSVRVREPPFEQLFA
jgi:hypothetical protein